MVADAAGGVHLALVAMLAVAVSFTELTELAFDATAICAFRVAGLVAVTELTVHEAVPSPLVQPLVNSGFWLDGWEASATDTFEAEPFLVETCTVYVAVCPRLTLDCELWTLTHSWVGGAELALALALVLALALALSVALGLAAMKASSVAAAVPALAEVADEDGEPDADDDAVLVCAGDADAG